MRVDLPQSDSWYEASERLRESLGIADDPNTSVQVYLGVRHALWEITQALAHTFAHRRTIGYTPFSGPEGEFVALQFAKDGFAIKALTEADVADTKNWLEAASKQMLCLISAYDDPATGEILINKNFSDALKDQRIFKINVSHSYHAYFNLGKPGTYDIQIISLSTDLAVAVLGERSKLTPPVAANLDWSKFKPENNFKQKSTAEVEQLTRSLDEFHKLKLEGFEHFITGPSLPDRAIVFCEEVEGLSLATKLAEKLSAVLPEHGQSGLVETLSLCRWEDPRQFEWLSQKGLSVHKLRGSVLIATEILQSAGVAAVAKALSEARSELIKEQS